MRINEENLLGSCIEQIRLGCTSQKVLAVAKKGVEDGFLTEEELQRVFAEGRLREGQLELDIKNIQETRFGDKRIYIVAPGYFSTRLNRSNVEKLGRRNISKKGHPEILDNDRILALLSNYSAKDGDLLVLGRDENRSYLGTLYRASNLTFK